MRVYDDAGNVIETHEAASDFKRSDKLEPSLEYEETSKLSGRIVCLDATQICNIPVSAVTTKLPSIVSRPNNNSYGPCDGRPKPARDGR
jgi:hypothetical protein